MPQRPRDQIFVSYSHKDKKWLEKLPDDVKTCGATNVTHQLAREIVYRSEDTSVNNVTLNLREPNFDLLKPTGVGRGIVDSNRGVCLKKFKDVLRLVRTQLSAIT